MSTRRWFALLVGALAASPFVTHAQGRGISIGLDATTLAASHEHMGDPMSGWAGRLDVPVSRGRYSIRLTAEQTTGTADARFGHVCGCFVPPGEIAEPLRDDAELLVLGLGAGRRIITRPRVTVHLLASLQHAHATGTTTGRSSGAVLERERRLFGADIGLASSLSPWSRLPLALEVGASLGALRPLVFDEILDAPTAFNELIGIARLRVGVSLRML